VGLVPRYLPFASTNNAIRFFRHAVALDERRVKFMPNWYHDPNEGAPEDSPETEEARHTKDPIMKRTESTGHEQAVLDNLMTGQQTQAKEVRIPINSRTHCHHCPLSIPLLGLLFGCEAFWIYSKRAYDKTCAGAHCDCGGGSVPNG
jgi:hypothetical protein